MKIKLKKGYQRKLIFLAKGNLTWAELSKKLDISANYLNNDLKYEKVLINKKTYKELCNLAGKNFETFIIEELPDNWGKSLGGTNSKGSTIKLIKPKEDEKLAEFIGALLGDGNINYYKRGKEIGVYQIKIAGDYIKDKEYHLNYLKPLCETIFNLKAREIINPPHNGRFLTLYSKELVEFLITMGLKAGNKIKNQITIPNWIKEKPFYLKACIRGLIDTDGSIYRMSNKDPHLLRIGFTNHNLTLLNDLKQSLEQLGFFITKSKDNKKLLISRKNEVEKYLKEIGFSNQKHIGRLQNFRQIIQKD